MSEPLNPNDLSFQLKRALKALKEARTKLEAIDQGRKEPIAIVGMAIRFPGEINSPNTLWECLIQGKEMIVEIPPDRWDVNTYYDSDPAAPGKMYTRWGGFVSGATLFDSKFFALSPREVMRMDPQQRLLLEVTWEALEHAGQDITSLSGSATGVFVGISNNQYTQVQIETEGESCVNDPNFFLGSACSAAAGRLSYYLDFRGPSIAVDTACSSSLVAVHLACQSLRNQECHLAIAGGVNVTATPDTLINLCKMGMLSADGHCKTFDTGADGFVYSEGCGVVILKRLQDALAAGDQVMAVICGSAINEDGRSNGLTAPNGLAQQSVIRQALQNADISPNLISYVEAHGSGTPLGDPIEVESIQAILCADRLPGHPLQIAAIKTNIGHLAAAAGIAGLIKTVLSLQHKVIPPHLNFRDPNPHIAWDENQLQVPTKPLPWIPVEGRRVAGVSSFGWAGTNAHVIVAEAPPQEQPSANSQSSLYLLPLSAKTDSALEAATDNLVHYLKKRPNDLGLADVAYTLQVGRSAFDHRRTLVCGDMAEAIAALETRDPQLVLNSIVNSETRPVTFMFPGLGDQYIHMAVGLYNSEPLFRQWIERCSELLRPYLGLNLCDVLYPQTTPTMIASESANGIDLKQMLGFKPQNGEVHKLKQTSLAQPAMFVLEYALAQLWIARGVKPQAMIGYSLGEYVAACLAGVFSLEDGLRLVAKRAQLIAALPPGAMLAVTLPEEKIQRFLNDSLCLSAVNGPMMCVLAGSLEAIANLEQQLTAEGIACRQVPTSHAFHSQMMEPAMASLTELLQTIPLRPPQIPYISNVTGTWIRPDQATDPHYWAAHMRQPVRFADGIQILWQKPGNILLEVGVGQMLGSLAIQHPARGKIQNALVLYSLPASYHQKSDMEFLLRSVEKLWLAGVLVNWRGLYPHGWHRICSLPTYPFEYQKYSLYYSPHLSQPDAIPTTAVAHTPPTNPKKDVTEWFHIPSWKRIPLVPKTSRPNKRQHWLFFVNDHLLGRVLAQELQQQGQDVMLVTPGQSFQRIRDGEYTINPQTGDDYITLINHLHLINTPPDHIVHLWNVTSKSGSVINPEIVQEAQQTGFYSLLFLAQALGNHQRTKPIHLSVVSNNMQDVLGEEDTCPEKATLLGPVKVIPHEYEQVTCSSIDIIMSTPIEISTKHLINELVHGEGNQVVAYRGSSRWIQSFESVNLENLPNGVSQIRQQGVYLITGGFGGLGAALAESLARKVQARLILVGRSPIPPRETWSTLLARPETDEKTCRQIRQIKSLESLGAKVLAISADVADLAQMQRVIETAHQQFGRIHGVFHTAGVPGEGLIQVKTPEIAEQVLRPKLQGSLVLEALLRDERMDFIVFYSSLGAVMGGLGEADYCAANAFLDALAHYKRNQQSISAVSINWGLWQWDAWQSSRTNAIPELYEQVKQMRQTYGITPDEGDKALWRILSTMFPQVLVSSLDLQATITRQYSLTVHDLLEKVDRPQHRFMQPRPKLHTPYVSPRDETERKIAEVWAEILAIEKVGINDHFLELGGNSLLGMMIIARLKKDLNTSLSAASLYEGPTVSELYKIISPDRDAPKSLSLNSERGKLRKQLQRQRSR